MSGNEVPTTSTRCSGSMVASADQLATQAGITILAAGGNAVDAAIATNAVLAVTAPHLCGMGGDLYALVHDGEKVHALNATGRAGSGSDAAKLRREGHASMPFHHDIRSVTVPGCVDGWVALHDRFGELPLHQLFAPAIQLATDGFPASPLLVASLRMLDDRARESLHELVGQAEQPGAQVRRLGVAQALRGIAEHGRDNFYGGLFGEGLRTLGPDLFGESDLATPGADWVRPLSQSAFSKVLYTIPPNSQGYLILGAASLADRLELPDDPNDPLWAHLLIEAATVAGHDRPDVLHDRADGQALLNRIIGDLARVNRTKASRVAVPTLDGDTTYLCTVDDQRMGVSLIQSNASGFGSWLVEPNTNINLHNRGLGFSLEVGHPAELAPGHRPPHTLCPAMATEQDGSLAAVFGTMGGDGQPQILLQIAARLFHHGQSPAEAINAGRWLLRGPTTGFDTWTGAGGPHVIVEGQIAPQWADGLTARGHEVRTLGPYDSSFGHAHAILVESTGMLSGAADPRTVIGSVAGL
ncbi:MAG: gamma-glutamyltransferase family protein [Ilumatobacteraceae bacterium]